MRWLVSLTAVLLVACTSSSRAPNGSPSGSPSSLAPSSPSPVRAFKPLPEPPSDHQPLIAFHADPGARDDTYVMRPDGTGVKALTQGMETVARPVWSPDGRRLAIQCCASSFGHIYVMNSDGSGLAEVTTDGLASGDPSWAPDSRVLAYNSDDLGAIVLANLTTGFVTRIPINGAGPVFSPDGRRIAFFQEQHGNVDVFVAGVEGRHVHRLTTDPAPDHSPQWSPDGKHIAFISERNGDEDIFVMQSDGSHQQDVSRDPQAPDESFEWSPDGRRLVYTSYRHGADPLTIGNGDAEVFVVGGDGSRRTNLTRAPHTWEGDPTWSPDGRWIAFTRRTNRADVMTMRSNGSHVHLLRGVAETANDCCPDWRP